MTMSTLFKKVPLLTLLLAGCVTPGEQDHTSGSDPYHDTVIKWHQGNIESAFVKAKQENKLVFLYWGAKWCPPCNEIKAQIFSKPQFAEIMKTFIPVYLDGDLDYAQAWGEFLQVTGYPTMLVLDASKNELMRLGENIDMEEFTNAITTTVQASTDFSKLLSVALSGGATKQDWQRLAYFSWADAKNLDLNSDEMLEKRLRITTLIPTEYVEERALLSAKLLEAAVATDKKKGGIHDAIREKSGDLISAMLVDPKAMFAARSAIIISGNNIITWAYGHDVSKRRLMQDKWLTAADRLSKDPRLSNDQRLWSIYPAIVFYKNDHPTDKALSAELITKVRDAVKIADKTAQTPIERQSVIPGAGFLLAEALLYQDAFELLEDDADDAKAPFYYYSTLARIADMSGDKPRSLRYIAKASSSAEGRATKLQWLESDISYLSRINDSKDHARLTTVLEQFYDTLFATKDGFSGRSYRTVKKVGTTLAAVKKPAPMKEAIKNYAFRCLKLQGKDKTRCDDHFKQASSGAG